VFARTNAAIPDTKIAAAVISDNVISDNESGLKNIIEPDCNISIWKRSLCFDPAALLTHDPKRFRILVPSNAPKADLYALITEAMIKAGYHMDVDMGVDAIALAQDISRLCVLFQAYTRTPKTQIRLEIIDNDACRKFHSDFVTVRLISTYLGPGTQWINSSITYKQTSVPDEDIHEMAPGDVGIFKGRMASSTPAIHRSPPIERTGQKRFVLVLNPEEEENW
jgi:hypothetical protein